MANLGGPVRLAHVGREVVVPSLAALLSGAAVHLLANDRPPHLVARSMDKLEQLMVLGCGPDIFLPGPQGAAGRIVFIARELLLDGEGGGLTGMANPVGVRGTPPQHHLGLHGDLEGIGNGQPRLNGHSRWDSRRCRRGHGVRDGGRGRGGERGREGGSRHDHLGADLRVNGRQRLHGSGGTRRRRLVRGETESLALGPGRLVKGEHWLGFFLFFFPLSPATKPTKPTVPTPPPSYLTGGRECRPPRRRCSRSARSW